MSVKIFSGRSSKYLARKIVETYYQKEDEVKELNEVNTETFNDGEISVQYLETIRQDKVFIVQSTFGHSDNMMELFLMLDAAKRASAKKIVAIIPYFGYARQDRKDKPRVPISAKLVADLLTSAGADRVVTVDLHADQVQGFFNIPVDHLSSSHIFVPYLKDNFNLDNLVIASPDVGGSKRASRFSSALNTELVLVHKERKQAGVISSMKLIGDVKGKDVVLIDDIIDTGGTLTKAANLMMDSGALSVRAICTHPVLSGNAYDNINRSLLTELITTDTIPIKEGLTNKIKVLSVDGMIANAIHRIVDGKSLSDNMRGTL